MLELWKARTPFERLLEVGRTPTKVVRKEKHKSKNAEAHNLFEMGFLDVDALEQQESERIKIGVDHRVQERRHGRQSFTCNE